MPEETISKTMSLYLSDELRKSLKLVAGLEHRSVNNLIAAVMSEYCTNKIIKEAQNQALENSANQTK